MTDWPHDTRRNVIVKRRWAESHMWAFVLGMLCGFGFAFGGTLILMAVVL